MFDPFKDLQKKEELVINEGHHAGHNHNHAPGHQHHHHTSPRSKAHRSHSHSPDQLDDISEYQNYDFLPKIK